MQNFAERVLVDMLRSAKTVADFSGRETVRGRDVSLVLQMSKSKIKIDLETDSDKSVTVSKSSFVRLGRRAGILRMSTDLFPLLLALLNEIVEKRLSIAQNLLLHDKLKTISPEILRRSLRLVDGVCVSF